MKSEVYNSVSHKSEFQKFTDFFLKYLNGSASFEEAYMRAASAYKRIFNKTPYQNCQSFLSDFYKSQYDR